MSLRIVEINGGVFGSTGRIMFGIADAAKEAGHDVRCFSPVTTTNRHHEPDHEYMKIGSFRSRQMNVLCETISGFHGSFSRIATRRLLKRIDEFSPDIIQLHTIHGSYINLPMLFRYIRTHRVRTVWTLHDCWSFTGGCPYFDIPDCDKWKSGCGGCPIYREYPKSMYDNTSVMYRRKKSLFTGIEDLHLVTPSAWLKELVGQSFLRDYPVRVINNGIDLSRFCPAESDFRKKYGLQDKYVLLGVAFGWGERKGLDIWIKLAQELSDRYRIVLVGTNNSVDSVLPDNVLSVHRTQDVRELCEIYSAADLFVNPTREDNFPTVNIEALACGTPVLTFRTGGSPEIIDEHSGSVVEKDDFTALVSEIERISVEKPFDRADCLKRASEFDEKHQLGKYVRFYEELCDE